MALEAEIKSELKNGGVDFVHFVDISHLSGLQNKNFPNAILFGIAFSPEYIQKMIPGNPINKDEFLRKESVVDKLADHIENYLQQKGYSAYSQSEDNLSLTGFYDEKTKNTPLPHKTIALLAGLGWIGKNNLLISPDFGCAFCMCTVLTNAPLKTVLRNPAKPRCESCSICKNACSAKAIKGNLWNIDTSRDEMIDVYKCDCCLKCLAFCPWTQSYMKNSPDIIQNLRTASKCK